MVSDTDFWTAVIGGSANLVMAGAMFIQTVIIICTAGLAYRKYSDYINNKKRAHAIAIKKDTQKLLYIQDNIFNKSEPIDFQDYQADLKGKMSGDHHLMYVKSVLRHNLYMKYKKEIEKLQMRVERELEFLGDKKLKSLNEKREAIFMDITRKYLVVEGKFTTLYTKQDLDPEILKNEENVGYAVYQSIPELIGNKDDQPVLEINLIGGVSVKNRTQKPRGLKLLDKQFYDSLAKFY
ncbi:hypothetical protein [Algoriphagus hitonicola]|uniref:Uncharacterized protein n=1 Tax=Algoriphagus hitonicola TaxID=435880 RepID=A0A1I2QYU7_9BACT|nr:hypothetical protein [Algoriphagus hitonicola]SFG30901.1 hypothetical protein SAMN04487988_102408 [Algoriphagus hitonicola]